MTFDEYQVAAKRTINICLTRNEVLNHSLLEMCSELGEIHGIYQKVYQGHKIKIEDLKKEVGDLLWGLAEFCTINNFRLDEIAQMNIDKLKERYPNGFEPERSVYRED